MTSKTVKWSVLALTPVAILALASCSSTPEGQGATIVSTQQGVPGGIIVDTFETTATVTGIDAAERKVTLVSPQGEKTTYEAGPEAINFDQIHIGDQLKVTAAEEIVIYLADKDAPPGDDGAAALVALAPKGAKPGGLFVHTTQLTAKVTDINLEKHKATLQFQDGTSKTVAVRKDVDLTQRKVGEEVVIRITAALAIRVEKP
jgi:hypothetical protein